MALLGIPSGSLIGRLGARTTMLLSDALRAPLIALVPLLHWAGHLSFGALLVIVFLLGAFTAPYITSQRLIIPELFGDDERLVSKASALFGGAHAAADRDRPGDRRRADRVARSTRGARRRRVHVPVRVRVHRAARRGRPPASRRTTTRVACSPASTTCRRDRLLGPMTLAVIILDGAAGAIAVAVPLVAYTRYDRDVHVAGWIFTSFGVGAVSARSPRRSCSTTSSRCASRVPRWLRDAAALGDRRGHPVARRVRRGRRLRLLRADGERADDGHPLDAAAARAAREGDDGGHDGQRSRRPGGPARGRPGLPRLRERRRLDHGRRRPQRRCGALDRGRAASPDGRASPGSRSAKASLLRDARGKADLHHRRRRLHRHDARA